MVRKLAPVRALSADEIIAEPLKKISQGDKERIEIAKEVLNHWIKREYRPSEEWFGRKFDELMDMDITQLKVYRGVCRGQDD